MFWVLAWLSCVKGNPGLTQNFSKKKKKNNKTDFQVLSISSIELCKSKPRFDSKFLKIAKKL